MWELSTFGSLPTVFEGQKRNAERNVEESEKDSIQNLNKAVKAEYLTKNKLYCPGNTKV